MDQLPRSLIKATFPGSPPQRSLPLGGWISFWKTGDAIPMPTGCSAAGCQQEDMSVLEVKGTACTHFSFDLLAKTHPYWLVFSFVGRFSSDQQPALDTGQYTVCSFGEDWASCQLTPTNKVWLLMIGIPDGTQAAMRREWSQLGKSTPQRIGYRQQQVLKKLQQVDRKPYSTPVRLLEATVQFLDLYQADMLESLKTQDVEQVALYHRAVDHIRKHYLDADIDRNHIADALNVSVRTLNRAFEGKTNNIISTIRLVRLHKARDLVRSTELSLEEIAFKLHYTDAKHLGKKYQALFGRSPAQERKAIMDRKKQPRQH